MLIWDGLQVQIPERMEPAILDRGYIRLFGEELPTIDFRFGAEKSPFDPHKDGRRILRAAGLAKETLESCSEPWTDDLPGILYNSSRLYVLQFRESLGVVAALFSEPPPPDMVQIIFTSLNWFPPGAWRRWCCYDLTFETPPDYAIHKAVFHPGRFHLTFSKGSRKLIFDRLAPANVLLANTNLVSWCKQNQRYAPAGATTILSVSDTEADIFIKPSFLSRTLPWLPGFGRSLRGKIRHDLEENKILMLAEQGPKMTDTYYQRILAGYAITQSL